MTDHEPTQKDREGSWEAFFEKNLYLFIHESQRLVPEATVEECLDLFLEELNDSQGKTYQANPEFAFDAEQVLTKVRSELRERGLLDKCRI